MAKQMIRGMVESIRALPKKDRVKVLLLLVLLVVHVVVSAFFVAPGHFSIDEGIYHFMTRGLVTNGSLTVWNGYEEFTSPELALPLLLVRDGALAPQYPSVYSILAAPFYWAMGYHGLFRLNALAFAATIGLCFLIARRLFRDVALSLNACLILSLATFAWQYSQAAWPHALSMFMVSLALYCVIVALQSSRRRDEFGMAFVAGLVLGIGVGVRLDTVFAFPAVLLPFLFAFPSRPLAALSACLGMLPGLLALAAINQAKFGLFSPFTYGTAVDGGGTAEILRYLPLAAAGLVCALGAWIATRPTGRQFLSNYRSVAILGVVVLGATVLVVPQTWAMASRLANGTYQLLVDFRIRDIAIKEGGLERGPSGGMFYLGSLKKSLLQSSPFLVALVVPLVSFLRGRDVVALGILFLVPASYVTVYSYFAWHGGQALNLRYFVPALPFFAILTAYAWRDIAPDFKGVWVGAAIFGAIALIIFHAVTVYPQPPALAEQETIYLTTPLVIAALIGILLLASLVVTNGRATALRGGTSAAVLIGLVWGGLVSLTYDFPQIYSVRHGRAELAHSLQPLIQPDSILFIPPLESFFGLIETSKVRFALPQMDNFNSFRPLIDFHLDAGHGVYMWVAPFFVPILQNRSLLVGLKVEPLYRGYGGMLVRLTDAPNQN